MQQPCKLSEIQIDCVLSGIPGYFKLRSQFDDLFQGTGEELRTAVSYLKQKVDSRIIISGLYNAYTEDHFANRAVNCNVPFETLFDNIYADSGGLQMVTLGHKIKEITPELRKKIYASQINHSAYAFSFDEIPMKVINETKYYLPERVKENGIKAGHNLKEQVDFFLENNASTKIFPIFQGWGESDVKSYAQGLLGGLNDEELNSLKCYAIGGMESSIYGTTQKIYDLLRINDDIITKEMQQHLHVLGVTGLKRVIPMAVLVKNGFAPNLQRLSFDSVSLTMSYVMGRTFQSPNQIRGEDDIELGTKRNKNVEKYYEELFEFWKGCPNFNYDSVDDLLQHSYYNTDGVKSGHQAFVKYNDKDKFLKYLKQEQYFILYNAYKYCLCLEEYLDGHLTLDHIFNSRDMKLMKPLETIRDHQDYEDWKHFAVKTTKFKIDKASESELKLLEGDHSSSILF